jgi:hypothetical protein
MEIGAGAIKANGRATDALEANIRRLRVRPPHEPPTNANASALGQNRQEKRQNLTLDALLHIWQHAAIMSETRNLFSLTRVAFMNRRRAKKQFCAP